MSTPIPYDPALPAIGVVIGALQDAYRPDSSFPPENPTTDVRFFAGEGPVTAAWDAHTNESGCDVPLLWVRVMRRYRTASIPDVTVQPNPCELPRVIPVEVGVARCAVISEDATWEAYEAEAVTSLEDSWRIEKVLCVAAGRLRGDDYLTATDAIEPFGPDGGILGWTGTIFIQFAN